MSKKLYGVSFDSDVELNKFNLAEEAEAMSSLIQFYSEKLSEAKAAKDSAEARVRLLEAEKNLWYRTNPPADLKVTDAVIASLVTANKEVQGAMSELLEAKRTVYTYDSAVNSLEHKSSMIKILTQLFSSGYYSVS